MNSDCLDYVEIIILGSGPAGLSTIYTLQKNNFFNYLVIDSGKDLEKRKKYDSEDAFLGIGGAGLYSDGKFSFYPCGTKIWDLPNNVQLKESYSYLELLFKESIDFVIPQYNNCKFQQNITINCFKLKEYPSFYLSFDERKRFINYLSHFGIEKKKILTEQTVIGIKKLKNNHYEVTIENNNSKLKKSFECEFLVLGGGKYFPYYLDKIYKHPQVFKRYEYGGRIYASNSVLSSLFSKNYEENNLIDPKWICPSKLSEVEYRTFCMCVDGEVILCKYNEIKAFSGRSDCEPTSFTNFGFNVIVRDKDMIDFEKILIHNNEEYEISLKDALDEKSQICEKIYGEKAGILFRDGLNILVKQFRINIDSIKIIGPTIEGVGFYPEIKDNLSMVENENMYVVGDSTGIFRGIIPSMLSGIYVALSLIEKVKKI